jgi:hypothetical protein
VSLTANGVPLTSAVVTWPWCGPMVVEMVAPDPVVPVANRVTVIMGNLTIICSLIPERSGEFAGEWRGLAVSGAAGWRRILPAKGYRSPVGVVDMQVIADAATSAGETMAPGATPRPVGQFYTRRGDLPASQVFELLTPSQTWWVAPTGVTFYGTRPESVTTAEFVLENYNPARGKACIESDEPGSFAPGVTFTDPMAGSFRVNSSVWYATADKLRGDVWIA